MIEILFILVVVIVALAGALVVAEVLAYIAEKVFED